MPQLQVLPYVPSFGEKLADTVGKAAGDIGEAYYKGKEKESEKKKVAQFQETLVDDTKSPMQKISAFYNLPIAQQKASAGLIGKLFGPQAEADAYLSQINKNRGTAVTENQSNNSNYSIPQNQEQELSQPEQTEAPVKKQELSLGNVDQWPIEQVRDLAAAPGALGERGKIELDRRKEEAKFIREDAQLHEKKIERLDEANKEYIDKTADAYKGYEFGIKPRLLQLQKLSTDADLITPTAATFMEKMGIPLGALEDPSNELYQKVSQDLLKGLPETFGNRILKVEVENFLRTIPTLLNSADGRRMIATNMLKLGEMHEVSYNEMRRLQGEAIDKNKPLSRDFQQKILDNISPQLQRLNQEFVKLSEITSVPEGESPWFDPEGNIVFVPKDQEQWAIDNQGRRIW